MMLCQYCKVALISFQNSCFNAWDLILKLEYLAVDRDAICWYDNQCPYNIRKCVHCCSMSKKKKVCLLTTICSPGLRGLGLAFWWLRGHSPLNPPVNASEK